MPAPTTVEIVESNSQIPNSQIDKSGTEIVVDVAGAVERPGVYTLGGGARTGDALVAAGGLAASADRAWVAQTLNLAAPIKDGEKIFIPQRDENNNQAQSTKFQTISNVQNSKLVHINTASVAELDVLPGIGAVRAQAIVDNRPYASTEELVTKAKIPESIYAKIKDQLTIY
jgi:competence protein ComEA